MAECQLYDFLGQTTNPIGHESASGWPMCFFMIITKKHRNLFLPIWKTCPAQAIGIRVSAKDWWASPRNVHTKHATAS